MVRSIVAIFALAFATLHASAQDFSTEELARRPVERRAVEAVIWRMPAVNYDLMLQETLKAGGFELMFRLYAPTKALFDKAWVLSDVEKVN